MNIENGRDRIGLDIDWYGKRRNGHFVSGKMAQEYINKEK
jgi:hypothetical protein